MTYCITIVQKQFQEQTQNDQQHLIKPTTRFVLQMELKPAIISRGTSHCLLLMSYLNMYVVERS